MSSTSPLPKLHVEPLREGWLVRGTTDAEEALAELSEVPTPTEVPAGWKAAPITGVRGGHFRKVPGQWSDFRLHDATPGPGAFPAVIFYTNGREH